MLLTPLELLDLIQADQEATALFKAGAFGDCALRCQTIAPKVPRQLQLSKLGVLELYIADRATGHLVLERLEAISETNKDARLMLQFMGPYNPSSLPNFGVPEIRQALTAPEPWGLGLTPSQAAPLLAASEQPDTINATDVEKLQGLPWQP